MRYAHCNARCRVFSTLLGDVDSEATLGCNPTAIQLSDDTAHASQVAIESSQMATDFLLHVLSYVFDLQLGGNLKAASDIGLVPKLGLGVVGYNRDSITTLSKSTNG